MSTTWTRNRGFATRVRSRRGAGEARIAILNRYLQVAGGWEAQPEEEAELGNAIDILQALKRTTERTRI